MEDDDSSIELVYEDQSRIPSPIVKNESADEVFAEDDVVDNVESLDSVDTAELMENEEITENPEDEENVNNVEIADNNKEAEENKENEENPEKTDSEDFNQDTDPMGLLELLEKRTTAQVEATKDATEEEEPESTIGEVSMRKGYDQHEWCFNEPDSNGIWCLFCNIGLKFSRPSNMMKHHTSHNHKERSVDYVEYLNQLSPDEYRLYSNRDFDGDLQEARDHRRNIEDDFCNFLWDKWETEHEWLVRTDTRFIAYCKYCHHKLCVGNTFMRKQHEEGIKHREFKNKAPKRRATVCGDLQGLQTDNITSDAESIQGKETDKNEPVNNQWYEKSKTSSDLCVCKLCDITLFRTSFNKHTISNLHRQNLSALDNPGVSEKFVKPDWESIRREHEWLIEDPKDPMEAYCKYCQKRLTYGTSAAKRLIHEHSSLHRMAVEKFQTECSNACDSGGESENTGIDNGSESNENEKGENENGSESGQSMGTGDTDFKLEPRKRRRTRTKIDVEERYPWVKNYKKDPRYYVCQYCKTLLRKERFYGKKHEETSRHQLYAKQYLEKNSVKLLEKDLTEKVVRKNEVYYPWLMTFKSGIDYVYCKYCTCRFSKKASRPDHQKTKRHREAEREYLEKQAQENNKIESETPSEKPQQKPDKRVKQRTSTMATQSDKNRKSLITEWQKKYPWLRYEKGLLANQGYCTFCEKSIFLPSAGFALKHQRCSQHIRARNVRRRRSQVIETVNTQAAEDAASEESSTTSSGLSSKRFKPSSLQTAIDTAKRLSAAHLEMITFMKKNGQSKSYFMQRISLMETPKENSTPTTAMAAPPPPSPSVDLNSSMTISRDPFDLFFTSMSESIKRLPADLASEGKLKVMQIIFDLEIRSQQRQNQSEVMITPNTSTNGSIHNSTSENVVIDLMDVEDEPSTSVLEKLINTPITQQQQQQQQTPFNRKHQQQSSHSQEKLNNSHQNPYNRQATPQKNSILQQQLAQPHQPPPFPPSHRNPILQSQLNSSFQQFPTTPIGQQRNMGLKATSFLGSDPNNRNSSAQQQRKNTNMNNYNHRYNNNNTSMSYTATPPTSASLTSTASSNRHYTNGPNTIIHNVRNINGNEPFPKKVPMIRPVPLSSLTLKKYSKHEEPQLHHIQLNSSTQSKIIPLDPKGQQR